MPEPLDNQYRMTIQGTQLVIHMVNYKESGTEWTRKQFPYPHHRIYYVMDGEAELRLKDRNMTLKPGHIYLLPAFNLVEAVCRRALHHYFIHFQMLTSFGHNLFELYHPKIEIPADAATESQIKQLKRHFRSQHVHSQLLSNGILQMLLSMFFENTVMVHPGQLRFSRVIDFIDENIANKIDIKTLADMMHLHPTYFSNIFTKEFRISPQQHILRKRINHAQILLESTSKKIKDIAAECGFDSDISFSRMFRKKTGMTPGEYRRESQDI